VERNEGVDNCRCLDEYQQDELLKAIIRRSCACEAAPEQLRTRILASITTVQVRYER